MSCTVAVVGAGVIGLSTAVNIISNIQDVKVTLIADKFSPNTTGDVAAGFWKPYACGDTPKDLVVKWGKKTWDHLLNIMKSPAAKEAGVQMISGYHVYDNRMPNKGYGFMLPRCSELTASELALFESDVISGTFSTSILCECYMYLPWLLKRFKENGGTVQTKLLSSLEEIYDDYDVIVNCTGIGAKKLVNDPELYPAKGHIVKVVAPWVKHFNSINDKNGNYYIFPGKLVHYSLRQEYVYLGGMYSEGDWSNKPLAEDRERILQGCYSLLPNLKGAKVVAEGTGLRPVRSSVRLEAEQIPFRGKIAKIIHNYGHGGCGITLHWGCAEDVTELVKTFIMKAKL